MTRHVPTSFAASLLSSLVYGLKNSPLRPPERFEALRTGPDRRPAWLYDSASGTYAAAFVRQKHDKNGLPERNANGNALPNEIIVAYRGTVATIAAERFHPAKPGRFDFAAHAPADRGATLKTLHGLIVGRPGETARVAADFTQRFRTLVLDEFAGTDTAARRRLTEDVPWVNTGHSQGGVAALFATAIDLRGGVRSDAITINAPTAGPAIERAGLYAPELAGRVTNLRTDNDRLLISPAVRMLAKLYGKTREAPLDIGRTLVLPADPAFPHLTGLLSGHDPLEVTAALIRRSHNPETRSELRDIAAGALASQKWPPRLKEPNLPALEARAVAHSNGAALPSP